MSIGWGHWRHVLALQGIGMYEELSLESWTGPETQPLESERLVGHLERVPLHAGCHGRPDLQSGWRQTCAQYCTIPPDHHPRVFPAPALLSDPEYPYPGLSGISLQLKDHLHTLPPQPTPKTHQYNHPPPSFPDNSV